MSHVIKPYNQIAQSGLDLLSSGNFSLDTESVSPSGIVVRSANLHDMAINPELLAIARAGAGTNNIPVESLTQAGIPVMNTPGANANAVKELVLAGLLIASRNLQPAWEATTALTETDAESMNKTVESMKKRFVGCELPGRFIGVIGLGKIGVMVANACASLGMQVIGFDPHITVGNAWQLDARVQQADTLSELLGAVQYVSLHVPLIEQTKGLLGEAEIAQLPAKATVLNFSRAGVVNTPAICQALESGHLGQYVCDFPEPALQGHSGVLAFPHLGASTIEASDNCAQMACAQLRDYLLHGNLSHCVNFPDLQMSTRSPARLCVFNDNVPNMVAQITQTLSLAGINISNLANRSRETCAYNLIDIDAPCPAASLEQIRQISGVRRVRQIELV